MKIIAFICRILLGLIFVVFGANIVHDFMHMALPPAGSPPAQFFGVFASSGWFRVVGVLEIIGGLLVLYPGTVPLGLCVLGPLIFNILCFHLLLLGGAGIGPGILVLVLEIILIYAYRSSFAGIITHKAKHTEA